MKKSFFESFAEQSFTTKVIVIVLLSIAFWTISIDAYGQNVVREGNTFVQVSASKTSKSTETKFEYKAKDGKVYKIHVSANGRAFILKPETKSGKQYLGEEISREVCKELGIEYVEKQKRN